MPGDIAHFLKHGTTPTAESVFGAERARSASPLVTFTVYGSPAPQGSKAPWGGESNPRTRPWRAAVTAEAAATIGTKPLLTGPVELTVTFYFLRPKSHYGTGKNAAVVKPSAPFSHATKPDLDKLLRAIGDSLTGVVIRDDSQIVSVRARKQYGETAKAVIQIGACK